MKTIRPYSAEIEVQMQRYYQSLSEKDRRRYAAIEAVKIGYGGISYMHRVLGCVRGSIRLGIAELSDPEAMSENRQRAPGGGRKSAFETIEGLDAAFLRVVERHTAGSPMDASIKWTHLTRQQIADRLAAEESISISVTVVDQLLKKHQFRRRHPLLHRAKRTNLNPLCRSDFELMALYVSYACTPPTKQGAGLLGRARSKLSHLRFSMPVSMAATPGWRRYINRWRWCSLFCEESLLS